MDRGNHARAHNPERVRTAYGQFGLRARTHTRTKNLVVRAPLRVERGSTRASEDLRFRKGRAWLFVNVLAFPIIAVCNTNDNANRFPITRGAGPVRVAYRVAPIVMRSDSLDLA